jgi:hypothetical protein
VRTTLTAPVVGPERREAMVRWCEENGIDPNRCYQVTLLGEGLAEVGYFQHRNGRPFLTPDRTAATEAVIVDVATVPPFVAW